MGQSGPDLDVLGGGGAGSISPNLDTWEVGKLPGPLPDPDASEGLEQPQSRGGGGGGSSSAPIQTCRLASSCGERGAAQLDLDMQGTGQPDCCMGNGLSEDGSRCVELLPLPTAKFFDSWGSPWVR